MTGTALGSLIAAILPCQLSAAPGDLDPAFSMGGKVLTPFVRKVSEGEGVVLRSDGKIVVVGSTYVGTDFSTSDFAIARYNPGGSLDSTFGNAGKVTTDFVGNMDRSRCVAIEADGKIVAAGLSQDTAGINFALARYLADGMLENSFGDGGKVTTRRPTYTLMGWC